MTGTSAEKKPRDGAWVLLVFVVAVPVAAYFAKDATGKKAAWLVAAQIAATAMAFLVPQVRQIQARRREASSAQRELAARTETRAAMNDVLDPILRQLGRISSEQLEPARKELIAATVPFVLHAASNLIGPDRSRACWFELTDEDSARLVPQQHAGRSGSPRTTFAEGTAAGDAAIGMVLNGENRLCEDIDADPPPGWDNGKTRDYKTFISVSVAAGDTAYGMLTLDALEPGDLNNDDLHLLSLMAAALAAALARA
ncbi:GAF domain-containing protein [Nocardioides sp. GY 10127]|uniref:GAF domain-containing protein n=1 Tax=Nocardioides sp. GY 10127 TaxID=2569762 RepID=UPI0010A83920|nr:GAF domain-containing protein [Nocardioides sp. GY 10127]TIC81933.1 hypothetical protein E8D37_12305 [Nocardioides sp. GY 10127]